MSKSIVLSLLCMTIFLGLSTPSQGQGPSLCPVTFPLPDGNACGSDGNFRCINEALRRYPASSMPQKCSCSDARPKTDECQCSIVCQ
ncbi:OLC1v1015760C1 [Oldenlandia corymbosa var. corymbosa]|uniref:OLC1v1015760C1 n=1 Tax=Oldenlandia corymbosa var. corymbosa TaxID=529605 RepID=A0AAV1E426_OLDCO|nr:OLC1v1015760C1 [Oldenlandia corymbosa var. corymbosa]